MRTQICVNGCAPWRVLSRLFRRLFLDRLAEAHRAGRLAFHGELAALADADACATHLAPMRRTEWVVYAKRPFAGPESVLAYLSRYTHRVANANSRRLALDERGVTFRWKDYRARDGTPGREGIKTLTLAPDEFIRRFLLHVLPDSFHRVRHYGLFQRQVDGQHRPDPWLARALVAAVRGHSSRTP
ncbi:IS91 family transposase ISMno23 [Methylobacterium frigidaeris]|uniref:IS91 family transposase ISMno23 n=1 Tax=Methylobacterium frigidaeris TaxID=2038277 RepID=A0AA37M8D7_9HYPH|nr:IS91 family transposase ISMno23 [Methylobacterium frigidaeris]